LGRFAPLRERLRSDEPTNGSPTDLEPPRDFTQTEALLLERSNGFIASIPIVPTDVGVQRIRGHAPRRLAQVRGHNTVAFRLRCLLLYFQIFHSLRSSSCFVGNAFSYILFDFRQTGLLGFHEFFEAIAQVQQQMEAVGNLLRLGSAFSCRSSVSPCSIAADNIDFRVGPQPGFEGLLRTIWQQVNRAA
jgi:hypothetical protein